MLGYDAFANKLAAVVLSGAISAAAGAAYALLFGYVGSTFASVQYSHPPACCGCCSAARRRRSGRSSARCSCTYVIDLDRQLHLRHAVPGRAGADPLGAVLPERLAGHPPRARAEVAAVTPLLTTQRPEQAASAASTPCAPSTSSSLPGEIRALIGPNGAGKTTFVSLISGRIAPTAGADRLRRRRHHPTAGPSARAPRHRLHVPDHQRLSQADRL